VRRLCSAPHGDGVGVDCGVAALRAAPANDPVGGALLHNSKEDTFGRTSASAMKPACRARSPLERRRGKPLLPEAPPERHHPPPQAAASLPLPGTVLRRGGAGAEGGEGQARSDPRRDRAQAAWRDVLGAKAAEHGPSGRPMRAQPRADAPLPLRPAGPRKRAPRASADRTCDGQTPPAAGSRESFSRRVSQASEEGLTSWSSRRSERSDARREGDYRDPLTKKK